MTATRQLSRFLPVALALALAGCSFLSGDRQAEQKAATADQARQHADNEQKALENQAAAARMKIAGDLCENERRILQYSHRFLRHEPLPMPPAGLTMAHARCAADGFVKGLIPSAGRIVGYKSQQMPATAGNQDDPVTVEGALLEKMVLPNGVAVYTSRFATHPRVQAGIMAVVRSPAIHDAQTPRELLANLSFLHPFIELPDLAYEKPDQVDAVAATLANANARFGVLGEPIPVRVDQLMVEQLGNMTVRLKDQNGKELEAIPGSALDGNPLNAMLALIHNLEKKGVKLRPGNIIAVAPFGGQYKPEAKHTYRLTFEGLEGNPSATVHFQ
ncbi:MAG: hypothetical protein Q4D19_06620 [Lautropia sp.]|nr:hypothetical protein [Lautropia sp.]